MRNVGYHYKLPPQAPVLDDTEFVDAGCIRIGVEHRELDDASLVATYEGTEYEDQLAGITKGVELRGVSLHVYDAQSGWEYLRFDCFEGDEHYHYLRRWETADDLDNHMVFWDTSANDAMLPWALERIRGHLPGMLTEVGAEHLIPLLDAEVLAAAVDQVDAIAARVLARHAR